MRFLRLLRSVGASQKCFLLPRRTMSERADAPQLSEVLQYLNSFAPTCLAESWDNVGLLVEPVTHVPIKKVLLTIDLTEEVVKEAVDLNTNLIVAYHPPIFQSLKRITCASWKERIVGRCLEQRIAIFSPHTSWDAVSPGGLSDWLASPFEFESVEPLIPSSGVLNKKDFSHQLTILCSSDNVEKCSDSIRRNNAEITSKAQLESMVQYNVIVQRKFLCELETALMKSNIFYSTHERKSVSPKGCGSGRIGQLKTPITLLEAVNKMKTLISKPQIRIAIAKGKTMDSQVKSVALVAGSGGSILRGVSADLYVTGEMLHHDLLEANHCGASVILLNHSDSERGFLSLFAPLLASHFDNRLSVAVANSDEDPIVIV